MKALRILTVVMHVGALVLVLTMMHRDGAFRIDSDDPAGSVLMERFSSSKTDR